MLNDICTTFRFLLQEPLQSAGFRADDRCQNASGASTWRVRGNWPGKKPHTQKDFGIALDRPASTHHSGAGVDHAHGLPFHDDHTGVHVAGRRDLQMPRRTLQRPHEEGSHSLNAVIGSTRAALRAGR